MLVLVLTLMMTAACATENSPEAPVTHPGLAAATTVAGPVRGEVHTSASGIDIAVFRGIPYAAPPVGDLRWTSPQPPAPWAEPLHASANRSPCPQKGRLSSTDEDCLYLNVWSPSVASETALPVMVFIHGGGQVESSMHEYVADSLTTRGAPVVFVSMNYRLSTLAFLGLPHLTTEAPELGSGNYALQDQLQALRWVRDNISNFGGDPGNVTIFGESGGAQAVCLLLTSPAAAGMFQRAISQSGPCQWQGYPSLAASEQRGLEIATALGCTERDPLPCLRSTPVEALLDQLPDVTRDTASAQPSWGGGLQPLPMREAMASGRFNQVPLMQGSNGDEAMYRLSKTLDAAVTPAQYEEVLADYFGRSRVAAIRDHYDPAGYASPLEALSAVLTDSGMVSNNRIGLCNLLLANQIAAPHVPVFSYNFLDRSAPYPAPIFDAPDETPSAAHTKELSYLFDQVPLTPAQRRTADTMIAYWTNFATTGNPNAQGLPEWPRHETDNPQVLRIGSENVGADDSLYRTSHCKFWAEQGFASLAGPYPSATSTGPVYE